MEVTDNEKRSSLLQRELITFVKTFYKFDPKNFFNNHEKF